MLFFSKPRKAIHKGKQVYEVTFGVDQPNLFELGSNPVGVLENRLNNIVLFVKSNDQVQVHAVKLGL